MCNPGHTPLSTIRVLFSVLFLTIAGMTLYEFIKEQYFPHLTKWQSHCITIIVSTILASVITMSFVKRRDHLRAILDKEMFDLIIAEEKVQRLLEDKKILLQEVHHRIKNNMLMIASLLEMQAYTAKEGAAELLNASRERVLAMMKVYEYLYRREDYREMPLGSYLNELADTVHYAHASSNKIVLKKEIENFETGIKIIYPIGLIVNELMVNAYKYAFPAGEGIVMVKLREVNPGQLELIVKDNGIGMNPEQVVENSGFGMNLTRLLAAQISGQLKIINENGTKVIITAPFEVLKTSI